MTIRPSPVVALNRAIAVAQNEGPERGLEEIRSITDRDRLAAYPFYPAALGELELRRGRHETAREHFRAAIALARNPMERRFLDRRVGTRERDSTFCRSSGQVREDDAILTAFPLRTKNRQQTKNDYLTGKAPYKCGDDAPSTGSVNRKTAP